MNCEHKIRNQTPIYIYNAEDIRQRANELLRKLSSCQIYYSVKANSNSQVLRAISNIEGIEAEVCSIGELKACIEAGFDPEKMIYGGPGKTRSDIKLAISLGIRKISIESLNELVIVKRIEELEKSSIKLIVRVLFDQVNTSKLNMMKPDSKFGFTLDEVKNNRAALSDIYGIHVYLGTQCDEKDVFDKNIKSINKIVLEVERILGKEIQSINYGGGLAWPYLIQGTASISNKDEELQTLPRDQICFEFGRYLVASSGSLYTTVLDVKSRNNKQVVILDAGIQTIAGLSATGRLLRPKLDYFHLSLKGEEPELIDTAVYGPLCTPADYFTLNSKLPKVNIGDVVVIPNSGAYGFATGMQNFLMRKVPTERVINV
ncbi:diaminopimelate decarboxylase family protein [Photorhabdus laumondii]